MIGHAPTFSVSQFVAAFNQSIDVAFPSVTIVGELANFRISKNMWVYFDLKDEEASVKFFGSVRTLPGPLEDGMMIEVVGRPYLHPKFGFSVQVHILAPVGKGAIKQAKDLLADKLKKEGLFDPERKRPLPYPPTKIALISSVESAGYSDFIKVATARWPRLGIEVYDVMVQGQDAPGQITVALTEANLETDIETIVVVRGGGSADDLIAFDHEQVVRAVAASRIPTLVGVGHERDVSLAELAADLRASTPSNAAELLVPDRRSELSSLKSAALTLDQSLVQYLHRGRQDIRAQLESANQSLLRRLGDVRSVLKSEKKLLSALDPKLPLGKGYALVRDESGKLVVSSKNVDSGEGLSVEFSDGKIGVSVQ